MQTESPIAGVHTAYAGTDIGYAHGHAHASGVSWGAVLAGAAAAAALSFILLILGVGLGLSSVSPWSGGASAGAIGTSGIVWLAFMELASAGMGGYLAGRLRIKWTAVHTDEVYFRDTAHGLLAWAVATLLTAGLMAGAVQSVIGGAINAGAGAANAAGQMASRAGATNSGAMQSYYSDMLMRTEPATADTDNGAMRLEVGRIFAADLRNGALSPDDRQYLAATLSKRTGLSQADAERRVDDVYARLSKAVADAETKAKAAADQARKAAAHTALWMFVALLIGAFVASLCATFGGRQRDGVVR
jgi:hypothetical protein